MANLKLTHQLCNNRRGSPAPVKQEAAAPVEIYQALGEEFGLARDDDEELDDLNT